MLKYNLEENIKKGILKNLYVFCGIDENLIKEKINYIVRNVINQDFLDLNYVQFDGEKIDGEEVFNACETLPFMSEKKVVIMYRCTFLEDGSKDEGDKLFKFMEKYVSSIPEHCLIIMYYIFKGERDKPSNKLRKLEKYGEVIKVDKLKGEELKNKIRKIFDSYGKNIGKTELALFCEEVDNNMNIIENEVHKLCAYTEGRDLTKEDIYVMMPQKSEHDIFNLVDFLSQKKIKKALDIFNELVYKGEKIPYILYMIERQFNLLLQIKLGITNSKNKDVLSHDLKLNPYICEKLMMQSKKFSLNQIEKIVDACLETEKRIKSLSTDSKVEMEFLMMNTIILGDK